MARVNCSVKVSVDSQLNVKCFGLESAINLFLPSAWSDRGWVLRS